MVFPCAFTSKINYILYNGRWRKGHAFRCLSSQVMFQIQPNDDHKRRPIALTSSGINAFAGYEYWFSTFEVSGASSTQLWRRRRRRRRRNMAEPAAVCWLNHHLVDFLQLSRKTRVWIARKQSRRCESSTYCRIVTISLVSRRSQTPSRWTWMCTSLSRASCLSH